MLLNDVIVTSYVILGYIDVGDECWRQKVMVTILRCLCNFQILVRILYYMTHKNESYSIWLIVTFYIVLWFCIDLSVTISTKIELLFGEWCYPFQHQPHSKCFHFLRNQIHYHSRRLSCFLIGQGLLALDTKASTAHHASIQ